MGLGGRGREVRQNHERIRRDDHEARREPQTGGSEMQRVKVLFKKRNFVLQIF